MEKKKIGSVEHYYNRLGVAVVKLTAPLSAGDKIAVETTTGQRILEQIADSLQIGHDKIAEAKAGVSVGLTVLQKVHNGNTVYKI